jgi:hypothetical protein
MNQAEIREPRADLDHPSVGTPKEDVWRQT